MSSLHPARRSAERFNSLLQGERGVADTRDAELMELVSALQTVPRAEARPQFVADLRERLMLAAETELVVPDSPAALDARLTVRTQRTPRERRLAVALGGFAIVGATTSMAVAAQSALPGDVLYPLKRAIENAEAGFSVSDEAKGSTILANATGRLDEVDALTRDPDADAQTVSQTLEAFADQATEASELLIADYETTGSEDSINDLRDFASDSIQTLAGLEALIPAAAETALLDAAKVLFQIDTAAADLCPVCASLGITDIPPVLLASGDTDLDDAAVEIAPPTSTIEADSAKPDKPQGTKPPIKTDTTDDPANPLDGLESEAPNGPGTGDTGKGPKSPPTVSINTQLPSVGVPAVDELVDDVVEGVDGVLGGLTGTGK
jgi:hypothetical protein